MSTLFTNKGNATAWVIGIIAILALIIAWVAFNRSGEDVSEVVTEETAEFSNEASSETIEFANEAEIAAERATAQTEAAAEIAALEARVEAGEASADIADEVNEIEADLAVAYENAEGETAETWAEMETAFADLEDSLRDGTGDTLEFFANLSLLLESDVRTDETEMESEGSMNAEM